MGSTNQLSLIEAHKSKFLPPYLEVGSKNYEGDVPRIGHMFPNSDFTGVDMLEGDNVDKVIDLTASFEQIDEKLEGKRFKSIFCLSVMEHCSNPHAMARNLADLLVPGGLIYVSVPFSWKFHGYPSDYWRFTPEGIKVLFPDLSFSESASWISSDIPDDVQALDDSRDLGRFKIRGSWQARKGYPGRAISAAFLQFLGAIGATRWLTRHRYLMPPVMIDMIGRKPE